MKTREDWEKDFEAAKAKTCNTWGVMIDGNRRQETRGIGIETKKECVTVKKCKKIAQNIKDKLGFMPEEIKIFMHDYDYSHVDLDTYVSAMYNDCSIPMIQNKTAVYEVSKNRLTIYEDGLPIYCNDNGYICRDQTALCDCMYD